MKTPVTPDVTIELKDQSYDRFAEILRPHGIVVRDLERITTTSLVRGGTERESHFGFLEWAGHAFRYHCQKTLLTRDGPAGADSREHGGRDAPTAEATITLEDHDAEVGAQLLELLEKAFPGPPPTGAPAPPAQPWTVSRIATRLGCILLLIAFFAVCFFACYGFRSFLHAL